MFAEEFIGALVAVLTYQLVGVALFLPLELALPKAKASFADRSRGILFLLAVTPLTALVGASVVVLKSTLHLPAIPLHLGIGSPVVASIVLALIVDLQFYIQHRIEHRFFWRFHSVHHSIRHLSAANSFHHWTEAFMGLPLAIPLLFVDVRVGPTLALLTFIFRWQQFYIHSSSRVHLGPLRSLLVDNRYHRIHHSTDPKHYDRNFGAMTPLWDWLFGTLHMPAKGEWAEVGLKDIDEPRSLKEWATLPWRLRQRPRLLRKAGPACRGDGLDRRPA